MSNRYLSTFAVLGAATFCLLCSSARAQIVCEIEIDPTDNLKAKVTLSGSAENTGSAGTGVSGAAITNGTGVIFSAPDGVELIAGRTVGTIPAGALTFSYGAKTHNIEELIFRGTQDDLWFSTDTLFSWANGETVSASGTFMATFAAGPNGETLDDVAPGTYPVNLSTSNAEGNISFLLKISTCELVTNTNDSGAGSLRQAIADAADDGCIITFDTDLRGQTIRLTSGQLTIGKNLTIDASELPNGITISGDADGSGTPTAADSRVFEIGDNQEAVFRSLTITGGKAADGFDGHRPGDIGIFGDAGGGIRVFGDLTLEKCRVVGNTTGNGGSALDADGTGPRGDSGAPGGQGGEGGGIYVNSGTLIIRDSTISGNRTGDGGSGGAPINSGNPGRDGDGGHGGGIVGIGTYSISVINSTISGNTTGSGFAPGEGGGIYLHSGGTLEVANSTISGNSADEGGGLMLWSPANIENSIIARNTAPNSGMDIQINGAATVTPAAFNLIGDNDTVETAFPGGSPNLNGDFVGTSATPLDPLLGTLADNGGPTMTHLPLRSSLALDNGMATGKTPATDQRGVARPVGAGLDIGAVEAPDYAAIDAAEAARKAAARAALSRKLRKLKKKLKNAKRRKQVRKVKRFKKQIKKLKRQLRAL